MSGAGEHRHTSLPLTHPAGKENAWQEPIAPKFDVLGAINTLQISVLELQAEHAHTQSYLRAHLRIEWTRRQAAATQLQKNLPPVGGTHMRWVVVSSFSYVFCRPKW